MLSHPLICTLWYSIIESVYIQNNIQWGRKQKPVKRFVLQLTRCNPAVVLLYSRCINWHRLFGFTFHASFLFISAHCDNHVAENWSALQISDHHILFRCCLVWQICISSLWWCRWIVARWSSVFHAVVSLWKWIQRQRHVKCGPALKDKFTQKLKFNHYLLTLMQIKSREKPKNPRLNLKRHDYTPLKPKSSLKLHS